VTQADEAIQALYTKMYPVLWAGQWAVPSVLETRSPIQRPQVGKGFLDARFKGRRDDGPVPGMAALHELRNVRMVLVKTPVGQRLAELGCSRGAVGGSFLTSATPFIVSYSLLCGSS